jgi:hypothetical protein
MADQPTLFDVSPAPHGAYRRDDHDTSKSAGLAMRGERLSALHREVLEFFHLHGPATDEDLEDALGPKHPGFSTLRKRRSELYQAKRLIDTGKRKINRGGRPMILWQWEG